MCSSDLGHPENERCDTLAVEASKRETLLKDVGYIINEDEASLGI